GTLSMATIAIEDQCDVLRPGPRTPNLAQQPPLVKTVEQITHSGSRELQSRCKLLQQGSQPGEQTHLCFGKIEPGGAINFGELLKSAAPGRPLYPEHITAQLCGVK